MTAETLRCFEALADLGLPQRQRLLAQMHPVLLPARTLVLAAGQPGHAVYFLLEGTVKICLERAAKPRRTATNPPDGIQPPAKAFPPGTQVTLNLCGPGAVLGELSVIDGLVHSASVITRQGCRLLWMDKDIFLTAVREMPEVCEALLRSCSARLRQATQQLHAYATLDARGRVAYAVLHLAHSYGVPTPAGLRLDIALTQPEIAEMVGLTRTRVSTVISHFKRSGWLSQEAEGALVVHDGEALAAAHHTPASE